MKLLTSLLFSTLLLSCTAQTDGKADGTFKDVSNEDAKNLMAADPYLQIVDVRQNAEVARGMITGAVQMDISKPTFEKQLETLDKEKPVLVYCAAGGRSKTAQEIMQEKGFKIVYNLKYGFEHWED